MIMRKRRELSQATKDKISRALSGSNNPNYGKRLSPEHKNRIRKSMLEYWSSIK